MHIELRTCEQRCHFIAAKGLENFLVFSTVRLFAGTLLNKTHVFLSF